MYARPAENVAREALQRILHFVLPALCLACSRPVPQPKGSLGLCPSCRGRLTQWPQRACRTCGRPLGDVPLPEGYRCGACRRKAPPFERVLSAWSYQPPLDAVLMGLKFRRLEYLGAQIGRELAEKFRRRLSDCDLVVPVPLHWWRFLRRGYNQAAAIARPLARDLGLPVAGVLKRRRATPPQSRLNREARRRNLAGAFAVTRAVRCQRRHVLLVDDVTTTGTTLETAAKCLLRAGVASVSAITAARTPETPTFHAGRPPRATLRYSRGSSPNRLF